MLPVEGGRISSWEGEGAGGGEAANFPGDPSAIPVSSSQTQKERVEKAERKTPCFRKNRGVGGGPRRGSQASK